MYGAWFCCCCLSVLLIPTICFCRRIDPSKTIHKLGCTSVVAFVCVDWMLFALSLPSAFSLFNFYPENGFVEFGAYMFGWIPALGGLYFTILIYLIFAKWVGRKSFAVKARMNIARVLFCAVNMICVPILIYYLVAFTLM